MLQNAFANSSSSLIQAKVTGSVVFVLLPPISYFEFYLAYAVAAMLRGLVVGLGVLSVTLGMIVGVVLGLLAGYYGSWVDMLIMRGADVLFAFPGMLLAIAVVALLGTGLNNVIIAVAVFSVPVFARIVRASTLSLRQAAYVEAVRCAGAPDRIIILRHILPGTLSSVIVYFTMRIGTSILTAAGLSFIGLGPEPDVPEWGNILAMSRSMMMAGAWHMSV